MAQEQHQQQEQKAAADVKTAAQKYDPKQSPAFNAFEAAAAKVEVNLKSLAETIKNFRPSDDPRDIDRTRGISEGTQMLLGLVGQIQNIQRWITDGPGGGVGGYAPWLEKERINPGIPNPPEQTKTEKHNK